MNPQRVIRVASVVLNSSGYGYCTITAPSGVRWSITSKSVSTNVTSPVGAAQPTVVIYQDSAPNPAHFLEGTYAGNRDSSDTRHEVHGGESLTAEWTGGTAGRTATFRVAGTQMEG